MLETAVSPANCTCWAVLLTGSSKGVNHVITMDLHNASIQGSYFNYSFNAVPPSKRIVQGSSQYQSITWCVVTTPAITRLDFRVAKVLQYAEPSTLRWIKENCTVSNAVIVSPDDGGVKRYFCLSLKQASLFQDKFTDTRLHLQRNFRSRQSRPPLRHHPVRPFPIPPLIPTLTPTQAKSANDPAKSPA